MGTTDFIPRSDGDFNIWQSGLIEYTEQNLITWGINADDFTSLKSKQSFWNIDYSKASNKQNRTSADVTAKEVSRSDFEKSLRPFISQWLSNNNKVTDSDRTRMGLTVKSGTRTAVPVPSTSPVGTIDFSVRRQHTINFSDEASPRKKGKPTGVHGCEIYMKIDGDAPTDVSEMTYLTTDTATPYLVTFDGTKSGKTVYYWLRWVNTRSECGPWSSTISAMIVG